VLEHTAARGCCGDGRLIRGWLGHGDSLGVKRMNR
jgi:hypothetical protein